MHTLQRLSATDIAKVTGSAALPSLAVALKEGVDNALDAGATSIDILLWGYGVGGWAITDNGHGMAAEALLRLGHRGTTSKTRSFDDVHTAMTLGFRGEALASLAACCEQLTLISSAGDGIGHALQLSKPQLSEDPVPAADLGSDPLPPAPPALAHAAAQTLPNGLDAVDGPAARGAGTTVVVRGLYRPLPVRRAALWQGAKKSYAAVLAMLAEYAVIATGVRFVVQHAPAGATGKRQAVFSTAGASTLRASVANVAGAKFAQALVDFQVNIPAPCGGRVHGLIAPAEGAVAATGTRASMSGTSSSASSKSKPRQWWFLGTRPVAVAALDRVVKSCWKAYHVGTQPAWCLVLDLPAGTWDVNLAPDKRQALLAHEAVVCDALRGALMALWEPARRTFTVAKATPAPAGGEAGVGALDAFMASAVPEPSPTPESSQPSAAATCAGSGVDTQQLGAQQEQEQELAPPLPQRGPAAPLAQPPAVARRAPLSRLPWDGEDTQLDVPATASTHSQAEPVFPLSAASQPLQPATAAAPAPASPPAPAQPSTPVTPTSPTSTPAEQSLQPLAGPQALAIASPYSCDNYSDATAEDTPADAGAALIQSVLPGPAPASPTQSCSVSGGASAAGLGRKRRRQIEQYDLAKLAAAVQAERSCNSQPVPAVDSQGNDTVTLNRDDFESMVVIGQFNLGFICTRAADELFIVDQHASDEKARYEGFYQQRSAAMQPLMHPLTLQLTPEQEVVAADALPVFRANGFAVQLDDSAPPGRRLQLIALPGALAGHKHMHQRDAEELATLLCELPTAAVARAVRAAAASHAGPDATAVPGVRRLGGEAAEALDALPRPPRLHALYASRACRGAVMIGDPLPRASQRQIVAKLAQLEHPWNCPHGRPTMRHLVRRATLPSTPQVPAVAAPE